jgi:copper oxidase (laccase) domain-containing protein
MLAKVDNGVYYLQFPNLAGFPELAHAVFTRHTGVSAAPFDSLNIGFKVDDEDARVRQNRDRLMQSMPGGQWVFAHQVHGTDVLAVDSHSDDSPPTGDALVTRARCQMLVIQVADCQAVMLYDPVKKVIANIHAGWRSMPAGAGVSPISLPGPS